MNCPHCNRTLPDAMLRAEFARRGGKVTSPRKAAAARVNGAKGGRPRGNGNGPRVKMYRYGRVT